MNRTIYKILALFILTLLVVSCRTVNMFTHVKKNPRKYSMNYCGGKVKAPGTELNKQPWIVFSDHEGNTSYVKPGGKVKEKEVGFLDPFLVIRKKGDYLRLIKYTPDILKNGKLEHKKAEYCGWMHKSQLLLTQQSVTDIASGQKRKMLVLFSDTESIDEPSQYFTVDSVLVYKDLKRNIISTAVSPYSVVYPLKQSEKGDKTLIARKPIVSADHAGVDILGWMDNSLLKNIGQGLCVNLATVPDSSRFFHSAKYDTILLSPAVWDESGLLSEQYMTLRYHPVTTYCAMDSFAEYRAWLPLQVLDKSNNYIYNVNGGQITYEKFSEHARDLRKVNLIVVLEGKDKVIEQFPQLVNALQSLQPLFEKESRYQYQFSCIMTFGDNESGRLQVMPLVSDYAQVVNFLTGKVSKHKQLKPMKSYHAWLGLETAATMLYNQKGATNLIVVIGDKVGEKQEAARRNIQRALQENNIRLLGFQLSADYNNEEHQYNDFVLDISAMINSYADAMLKKKGDLLVNPRQVKRDNHYIIMEGMKNGYRLDFPANSITQGMILFPKKGEDLSMDVLMNGVDSMLQEIKLDNQEVTNQMLLAFNVVGNNRTYYHSLFKQFFALDSTVYPSKRFLNSFGVIQPGWFLPVKVVVADSVNREIDYRLLLSENELADLVDFVKDISALEVDLKYQRKLKKESIQKNSCDCPDDDLWSDTKQNVEPSEQPVFVADYAPTGTIRRYLYHFYISSLRECKVCKENRSSLGELSLAEVHRRLTGSPTADEVLNATLLKDIKKKKKFSDKQLDRLITYFADKKGELEAVEAFESNGEKYFWLNRKKLP